MHSGLNPAQTSSPANAMLARQPRLVARFAADAADLRAAQRLRAQTFAAEYGVHFDHPQGLDCDGYDAYCRHLNVYDNSTGRLIATTRLLSGEQAERAGGFYSAGEFDLSPLLPHLQGRILEIGRTCVHPDYRSGAAIAVLWSALAEYLLAEDFAYLIGCASIALPDPSAYTAVLGHLQDDQFLAPEQRVQPRQRVPQGNHSAETVASIGLPPLLKAYLRMNARIGGEACWDAAFGCADLFIVLDVATLNGRYAQRFLKAA